MAILDGRMLPAASTHELFCRQSIFVLVTGAFNSDSTRLGLCVPGGNEVVHDKLRNALYSNLYEVRSSIGDWVAEVELEWDPVANDSFVTVHTKDTQRMRDKLEDLILDAVRLFLTGRARQMGRQLVVLGAKQQLVPLEFEYVGALKSFVKLPHELELVNTYCRGVSFRATEAYRQACEFLKESLVYGLGTKGVQHSSLSFKPTGQGAKLEVGFNEANLPTQSKLRTFEAVVAEVLGRHCAYPYSAYDELLFQPYRLR